MESWTSHLIEGSSKPIHYTVMLYQSGKRYTPAAWDIRFPYGPVKSGPFKGKTGLGKPTDENLKQYVKDFEEGTKPGGPNDHLGVAHISSAEIKDEFKGEIVARYKA
jgi:hypothetical protein